MTPALGLAFPAAPRFLLAMQRAAFVRAPRCRAVAPCVPPCTAACAAPAQNHGRFANRPYNGPRCCGATCGEIARKTLPHPAGDPPGRPYTACQQGPCWLAGLCPPRTFPCAV
jgi:hypothetical protein